jgi:phosphohistidine phosphatase
MKLYLVQHAKALPADVHPERPLSDQGRREVQKVADLLRPLNLVVDDLWHSGKTRAAQTAEILTGAFAVGTAPMPRSGLAPNDDVASLVPELDARQQDLMIVGHMPFVARLASLLLTGRDSTFPVAFKNAGVVCLSRIDPGRWQVEWILTPQIIS